MATLSVLGPVEVRDSAGAPVRLSSMRQRRLLCALALQANASIAVDVLIELVWGDDLPADPGAALQTNMTRLRRLLPDDLEIVTEPRRYRLRVARHALDVTAFEDAIATGRIDDALQLWRGDPYSDLDGQAATVEVARLRELRATAIESWAQQRIDAGDAVNAVRLLEELVGQEPLRESAVASLMYALASVGRQADALRAFTRLRHALAEQLGIEPSGAVRAAEQRVLLQDVAATPAEQGSLPTPVSSFVGRHADAEHICSLLAGHRVVTLCGPGGVGKTRLATEVARRVAASYADGVVVVDLAAASGPDAMYATFAAALRVTAPAGSSLHDHLLEVLRLRHQLLLVDNCEHLVDSDAGLIERVVTTTAHVDVLATSREPLRVDGERVFTVAPLPPREATLLLRDRVAAACGESFLGEADIARLPELADRLDGLPIALELAAAAVRSFGVEELVAALDESFSVLRSARRTANPRHRSMRDVVQWSYDLLPEPERRLFDAIGTFAGEVDASGIAAVCSEAVGPAIDIRPVLAELVDRSLVTASVGGRPRYGMLATVRAFAREHLASSRLGPSLRDHHARWVQSILAEVSGAMTGPNEGAALQHFDAHVREVFRAFTWLAGNNRGEDMLRVAVVAGPIAVECMRGELGRLTDDAVAIVEDAGHPLAPQALAGAAMCAWQRGDSNRCELLCHQALAVAATVSPQSARYAEQALSNLLLFRGEFASAIDHGLRAVELANAAGDRAQETSALIDLAMLEAYAGHPAAPGHLARATAMAEDIASPRLRAWAAYTAGEALVETDPTAAVAHLEQAVSLATEVGATFVATVARHTLLTSAGRSRSIGLDAYWRLIDDLHRAGAWAQLWVAMRALAETLSRRGDHESAIRLLAAHDASARALPAYGPDAQRLKTIEAAGRQALGDRYDAVHRVGSRLDDDQAVGLARRCADSSLTASLTASLPARH